MKNVDESASESKSGKVVVLGTGSVGMRHLRVLRSISGASVIALPKRRTQINHLKTLGYKTCQGLEEAIQMGATQCIVSTETGSHLSDSIMALDLGLNLLVEKPLGCDSDEALQILEKAKSSDRDVFVACVLRFSESLNFFYERLPEVGDLHSVRIECQSYLPDWSTGRHYQETFRARAREGGVLLDLIHEIDYAGWMFGWPQTIQSSIKNLGVLGIKADESADLWWESQSGCSLSVRLDFLTRPDRRQIVACGSSGTIQWDGIAGDVRVHQPGGQLQITSSSQKRNDMFAMQAEAFLQSSNGKPDYRLATGLEGFKALKICDAARLASELNREVRIDCQ